MKSIHSPLFISLLLAAACSSGSSVPRIGDLEPLKPPPEEEGFQIRMSAFAPAGQEVWQCLVLDGLPVEGAGDFINMQSANHRQTPGMHHMDLMALTFTGLKFEPGQYDCKDLYTEVNTPALMDQGIILYASQQGEDEIVLPERTVATAPSASQYLFELHYVNTSDFDKEVGTYLNGYHVGDDAYDKTIWGGPVRDLNINVPPRTRDHVEWTRCEMTDDVEVIFLSSHTHELARNFEIRQFDGEKTGDDVIYSNRNWDTPVVENFNPPIQVKKGEGFEFRCYYSNHKDNETNWGLSAQDEMCQIGIVFTPGRTDIQCKVTQSGTGMPGTDSEVRDEHPGGIAPPPAN